MPSQLNKGLIGREFPPFVVTIERGKIKEFARAIGDDNPAYLDDRVGQASEWGDIIAPPTFMGYITRDFAYRTRGLEPPTTPLYVELTAPSGETWRWGPPDAPDRIEGTAGDWCRVVTQRIHADDTSLRCTGPHAREFLSVAQAFAGPPGKGRAPKSV